MGKETVILLHGLGRTPVSMALLAHRLERDGWRAERLHYPSTDLTLEQAYRRVLSLVTAATEGAETAHLVGHSLGGLMALMVALRAPPANLGRVVQLGSPNSGSEVAELAGRIPGVPHLMGPVLAELEREVLSAAGPFGFELGCIAGDLPLIPMASIAGVKAPNDGTVAVKSALHPQATDVIVLRSSHGLLPFDPRVAKQVDAFLKTGRFERR